MNEEVKNPLSSGRGDFKLRSYSLRARHIITCAFQASRRPSSKARGGRFEYAVPPKCTSTFHSASRQAADNLPLEKQYQYEQGYDGRDNGCNCIHDLIV